MKAVQFDAYGGPDVLKWRDVAPPSPAPDDVVVLCEGDPFFYGSFMHLYALNRGVLLTPFHNMALMSPHHSQADVDRHSEVFRAAVAALRS